MANVIKIKQGGANVTAPQAGDLKKGELGYTFNNDKLWIGSGDGNTDEALFIGGKLGSAVQAYDAGLESLAGLTTAANKMVYTTAADTYATTALTSTARSLLDDTSVSAMRTTLGVDQSGTDNSTNVTLTTVTDNYLSISGQEVTASTVPVSLGGTGSTTISAARTALDVDQAGTDNSTNVTLVTTAHDYLSLNGQAVTLGTIDISDDTNLTAGTGITLTGDTLSVDYGSTGTTACVGNDSRLTTDLGYTNATRVLTSSTGTNVTLPEATITVPGLMSAADKVLLNTVAPLVTENGASTIIDTVQEVIETFQNHAEGLNLITELDAKLTATSIIDGGTF
jgi:hypothetical protein